MHSNNEENYGNSVQFIDRKTFNVLFQKLEEIDKKITNKNDNLLSEKFLDVQEVCHVLKISKRQCQYLRDAKILPYCQIRHKIYFKAADVETMLNKNYFKANDK